MFFDINPCSLTPFILMCAVFHGSICFSPVDRYLGYFHCGGDTTRAVLNPCIHVLGQVALPFSNFSDMSDDA